MLVRFKSWLQKSGIKYNNRDGATFLSELYDTEMPDSINPFDDLIEDPAHPLARILRENALVGIVDTYNILEGKHFDYGLSGNGRKGLLDILLFPLISRRLIN